MKRYQFPIVLIFSLLALPSIGQGVTEVAGKSVAPSGEEFLLLLFGVTAIGIAVVALLFCVHFLIVLNGLLNPSAASSKPAFNLMAWINEKFVLGKLKPVEEEAEIALDHSYDGIVELDNGMPPWLRYLFSATIVFAVIYLLNYLVLDTGLNQLQEYEQELAVAEKEAETRKLLAANSLDESSVTLLEDQALVAEGKVLYEQNCRACHGAQGEGTVGPNLTDAYWLHGGKINDVFKVIKYGVPEKGMIAWQAKLKPVEIQKVASYILSIQGTNPPNAKAPQGDLFEEEKSLGLAK